MSVKATNPESGVPVVEHPTFDPGEIRAQVGNLAASSHFRNSKRCQALVAYVVEAYLEGALERVKERNIGCQVFGREQGYDTNQDSVVRTTAAEVRRRLAQYYLEPEHAYEIRLSAARLLCARVSSACSSNGSAG